MNYEERFLAWCTTHHVNNGPFILTQMKTDVNAIGDIVAGLQVEARTGTGQGQTHTRHAGGEGGQPQT